MELVKLACGLGKRTVQVHRPISIAIEGSPLRISWRVGGAVGLFAIFVLMTGLNGAMNLCAQTARRGQFPSHDWRPNHGLLRPEDYVGEQACAKCHAQIFALQQESSMARAAEAAADCAILRKNPRMQAQLMMFA